MLRFSRLIILLLVLAAVAGGCKRKEEEPPGPSQPAASDVRQPLQVVVPDAVRARWKAVRISVLDKEAGAQEVYTVPIGGSLDVPGSDLTLTVKSFLPAFIMDGTTITSVGNELKNPAAQVEIAQKGETLFRGWLFSLYPGAHAFKHPRYNFTLVDFVPVE